MAAVKAPPPLPPPKATEIIRAKARDDDLNLDITEHAKEQMRKRDLLVGDILYVLKHGFVYDEASPATIPGYYKYKMQCHSPNSGTRLVRVVVIPSSTPDLKIVTVMWVDE